MAELNKHLFGKIKGSFGSAVFRQRNGKNYISQKPVSYNVPKDENYFIRTGKFKMASKIASVINSNDNLKNIWMNYKPNNQSLINYLISTVYSDLNDNSINSTFQITPLSQNAIKINNYELIDDDIKLNIQIIQNNFDLSNEKKCNVTSILFANTPQNNGLNSFDVFSISSNYMDIDLSNPIEFNLHLIPFVKDKLSSHQEKIFFNCLFTYDENYSLVNFTSTSSFVI